jgi:hypothetical protein
MDSARLSRYSLSKGVSIITAIVNGDLMFADRAILDSRVELPKSFRQAYPRIVCLHVTNYFWNRQRCLLLLTAGQRDEFFTDLASLPQSGRDSELLKLFFIGGCEAVHISGSEFSIPKRLLNFLGAYRGQPDNATLCWLPPPPATSTAKPKRRRMLVPA